MTKKNIIQSLFIFFLLHLACSCKQKKDALNNYSISENYTEALSVLEKNCVSCHAPNKEFDTKIAPTLTSIKKHYAVDGINEEEFVNQMTTFLSKPTIEHSKMPETVQKFGLMASLEMAKSDYEKTATFLFNVDLKNVEWQNKYLAQNTPITKNDSINYLKKGMDIALATKAILGKNLSNAIKVRGTDKAVSFCNIKAIPLTDSMAIKQHATIKRVSDKNRNPTNLANNMELEYINEVRINLKNNQKPEPQLQEINSKMVGYYPILTNNLCLKCHGNPNKEIDAKTYKIITEKYPKDNATGYSVNELRGIWVVEMNK